MACRLGTRNDSRIEYGKLPGRQLQGFDLTVGLRTFDQHGGLVFYAAADKDPQQFLAFYMKDARVRLTNIHFLVFSRIYYILAQFFPCFSSYYFYSLKYAYRVFLYSCT